MMASYESISLDHLATHLIYHLPLQIEDFVEQMHQTGIHLQDRFCRVKNPVAHAQAREKANSRSSHPNVIAHIDSTLESKK
jgi:hypothetical protein